MLLTTYYMKFCLLPILLLGLLFLQPETRAQATPKPHAKYEYLLYLPKDYAVSKKVYSVIIYLHGSSLRGHDLDKLNTYGPPQQIKNGRDFDCIIVSPQCPDGKYWSTDNWFDSLYAELKTTYRVDTNRVYLTGISMGGYGAWQTAIDYPNVFAAVVPLCGGLDDPAQVCRIKNVPVWTLHGTADDVIPIAETERIVTELKTCNGRVTFTRLKNKGHGIQYLYEDTALYDWLFKQHK